MRSTNQTLRSEKTTAINPAKTIHRATTSIGLRVPHTIIIINLTPSPHIIITPSYPINSKGKTVS
jgi:hypothetical protein